jgi:glycine hydroxymethyltransferase
VRPDGYIDFDEVWRLAREHRPRLIWCGATAYVREFPFAKFAEVADEVGAYFATDVAHIAGLIVGGVHPSPTPHAHIITTTTHKTLRGPRGAMILVTNRGLTRDPELGDKIDRAIFPGLQGGPHDHTTAAIAVALGEAMRPEFKAYAAQVVANAKALGAALSARGFRLVTNGTDNHMLLVDLTPDGAGRGVFIQEALDAVGITVNKNTIPGEPSSAFYPSGVRLGTPAATTRGMREPEMGQLAAWMAQVREEAQEFRLPEDRDARTQVLRQFRGWLKENRKLAAIHEDVRALCRRFPVPGL